MICPKCASVLKGVQTNAGVLVDMCPRCRGCWLDKGEVSHFSPRPRELLQAIQAALATPEKHGQCCPRCKKELWEIRLQPIDLSIDRCNQCGGLWFDEKELQQLARARLGVDLSNVLGVKGGQKSPP